MRGQRPARTARSRTDGSLPHGRLAAARTARSRTDGSLPHCSRPAGMPASGFRKTQPAGSNGKACSLGFASAPSSAAGPGAVRLCCARPSGPELAKLIVSGRRRPGCGPWCSCAPGTHKRHKAAQKQRPPLKDQAAGRYHQPPQRNRTAGTPRHTRAGAAAQDQLKPIGIVSGLSIDRAFVTMACVRCTNGFSATIGEICVTVARPPARRRGGGTPDDRARKSHGAAPSAGC
jgi:hypothetical protein